MRKLALAFALLVGMVGAAEAQCNGVFPSNTICGSLLGGIPGPVALSNIGTVSGPITSAIGDIAIWNNITGTLLKDITGASITAGGPATFNFNGSSLQPYTFIAPALTLSGAITPSTQGETGILLDAYGAPANGTIIFSKTGGGGQFTGSVSGTTMTISAVSNGSLAVGQNVMVPGVPVGTTITVGSGGVGSYTLSNPGTVAGGTTILTASPTSAPTATQSGDVLGLISTNGWGTTGRTTQGATIQFRAEQNYTDTVWGSSIGFYTAPVGGGAAQVTELLRVGPNVPLTQTTNSVGSGAVSVGMSFKNGTAAAAGAQQNSPSACFTAQGWKTNATAGSQTVDWCLTNVPSQGTANPSTALTMSSQINNGGFVRAGSFTSAGVVDAVTGFTIGATAPSGHVPRGNGTNYVDGQLASSDLSDASAWSAFIPSLSCGTATFTVNSARSKTLASKTTFAEIDFTITAIGTCTQPVTFTMPNTANSAATLAGQEQAAATHAMLACSLTAASATATCQKNSGTGNPFLVNDRVVASGVYENQ